MKTKKSIKNIIASLSVNFVSIVVGLISQALFLKILGAEYLGINGLFSNIVSFLGIVELGIGSAIVYNLYKPLVNNDYDTINSLMKFYKKAYHLIAIIVSILGLIIMLFLPFFINEVVANVNIYIVYLLFIIDIICSYLLSYKRSILYADQKNYIINIIHMIYYVSLNSFQILFLYLTHNYYLYLIIKIFMRILENLIITLYVNKNYTFLNDDNSIALSDKIKNDIQKKVKALFFHKIGAFIILSTDNIIISKFINLITVGLYSNYYMIIDAVNKLFGQAIVAITPSIGHMLVTDEKEKQFVVFKKIRFANFWISSFSATCLLVLLQPFISIWVGKQYLLSIFTVLVLSVNFYQNMMRNCYNSFKEAAGIFYEDRFVPLVESILNIVFSIIFVNLVGLPGVFIGTIISGFALWFYSYPIFVYKKLFNRNYINYIKETIGYFLVFLIISVITFSISMLFKFNNDYIQFIISGFISILIPNILLVLIFYRSDNFKYYKDLMFKFLKKIKL